MSKRIRKKRKKDRKDNPDSLLNKLEDFLTDIKDDLETVFEDGAIILGIGAIGIGTLLYINSDSIKSAAVSTGQNVAKYGKYAVLL